MDWVRLSSVTLTYTFWHIPKLRQSCFWNFSLECFIMMFSVYTRGEKGLVDNFFWDIVFSFFFLNLVTTDRIQTILQTLHVWPWEDTAFIVQRGLRGSPCDVHRSGVLWWCCLAFCPSPAPVRAINHAPSLHLAGHLPCTFVLQPRYCTSPCAFAV